MNMTFWKTFWASLLASVVSGGIVLLIFFAILSAMISGFGNMFESQQLTVEESTILHMELDGPIGDYTYAAFNPNTFQMAKQFGLNEILQGIDLAANDDNVEGIFLNCDNLAAGMATIKEIRDALIAFQAQGKFVVSYHENYDKKAYYLASAAEELYVYPSGMLEFLGLGSEIMFLKGALEKLEVEMQIIRGSNNRFKSAVEPLIYDQMSEANRLQTQKYMDALWGVMTSEIGASRNLKVSRLNQIADSAYIRKSSDAVKYKMADASLYYDQVLDSLAIRSGVNSGADVKLLSFQKYAMKKTKEERTLAKLDDKNIAVIFAEGEIVDGFGGDNQIGGTSLSAQIRDARLDTTIQAVVLRVNSPGGSALASDIIWREVVKTKEAGKPFIVSMGDVAASGGYYIACEANRIFAQKNTITGSIGVFGIIPYTGDMLKNKLGVTFDRVQTNEHAVLSLNKRLTNSELKLIQQGVDDIYDDFIGKVGAGRGMTKVQVDSIGQGRVWAGKDAMEIGLIDEFGGLQDAINYAAEEASIEQDAISIKYYPEAKNSELFELLENFEEQKESDVAVSQLEMQLTDMYNYLKTIGTTSQIQARMPYLYWID
ncbi:MAG: signal peptide peptidase SppA [Crocinitomix sp.]|nr:signal peptide peptidase SppA [Crocinitomix sp.]